MRKILPAILAIFTCGVCFGATLPEAARTHTTTRSVGQFDAIRVLNDVNIVYRCVPDTTGVVRFTGTADFDNAFILDNDNGTLRIQVLTEDLGKPDLPTLYIYSDFLTKISNTANFDISVESIAPCSQLEVSQMGNGDIDIHGIKATTVKAKITAGCGNIVLSGTCREAYLRMVGTGVIQADELKAENVTCRILGGGSIGCAPEQNLKVRGIGSTAIYYLGDPVIDKKGGGKLIPLKNE